MLKAISEENQWVWLAGFTDGEGCLLIAKCYERGKLYYAPRITLTNTDIQLMSFIEQMLLEAGIHGGVTKRKRYSIKHRTTVDIQVSGQDNVRNLLWLIMPYLKSKGRQAAVLFDFISKRQNIPRRIANRGAFGLEHYKELQRLKHAHVCSS